MAIEFIGHKAQLIDFLLSGFAAKAKTRQATVLDLFCGTAAVSKALKAAGYRVIANDHLRACSTFAEAELLNNGEPTFASVAPLCGAGRSMEAMTAYGRVVDYLNRLRPHRGFFYRTYSPAGENETGIRRMYFTCENAGKIDAIRRRIASWEAAGLLSRPELAVLLRDLALAANDVANTAGTYGCYLKHWKPKALRPISLRSDPPSRSRRTHVVHCGDALAIASTTPANVVYADPPYTKRQYAAYYHVLETIVRGDSPAVTGSTGLRPWRESESAYCYKRRAPGALETLVGAVNCEHFFLSYNEDGQVPSAVIKDILSTRGHVTLVKQKHRRYKSSSLPHKGGEVVEHLYHVKVR